MSAILFKSIPITYSKTQILYFDAKEYFDCSNFRFLEEVKGLGPMARVASHKICFRKHKKELSTSNNDDSLIKTIKKIFTMAEDGRIEYGVPIGFSKDGIGKFNNDELKEFEWTKKTHNFATAENPPLVSSSTLKGLVNVGQGLSFIDEANGFMYDAGGSTSYKEYKKLIPKMKYTIVISHMHLDHYKYIPYMHKDKYIKKIYIPTKVYVGNKLEEMFDAMGGDVEQIYYSKAHFSAKTVLGYEVFVPNLKSVPAKLHNKPNNMSLIVRGGGWLLTGDSSWKIIEDTIGKRVVEADVSVPHHGSVTAGSAADISFSSHPKFHFSYGKRKGWTHPHPSVISDLGLKGILEHPKPIK